MKSSRFSRERANEKKFVFDGGRRVFSPQIETEDTHADIE
jgi:hypothetical protein